MRLPTRLLRRRPDSNKSDFGRILVLAGSPEFSGAAVLAAEASLRSGAGLVTLGIPRELNSAIIKIKPKEAMTLPLPQTPEGALSVKGASRIKAFLRKTDVLLIGPGLGVRASTRSLVKKVIRSFNKALVIDADGLNALAGDMRSLKSCSANAQDLVLTPHPGEMARLLGLEVKKVQQERKRLAEKFARDNRVVLALKGHRTVIVDWRGNSYINNTGNPGMSTAGSGDVLAGMIAAFLAQGLKGFEAAKYAAYLHGLAGDLAAKSKTQMGMIASDIIDNIPQAIKRSS